MSEGIDQLVDPISDAWMAELTEECQVLANLRVLDRERIADLAAGDRGPALALVSLELPEVKTHSPHDRLGGDLHSRGLGLWFAHQGVSEADGTAPSETGRTRGKNHAITACDCNDQSANRSRV